MNLEGALFHIAQGDFFLIPMANLPPATPIPRRELSNENSGSQSMASRIDLTWDLVRKANYLASRIRNSGVGATDLCFNKSSR